MSHTPKTLSFHYPAATCHEGIPIGNGNFGALIWGTGNSYHFTINRQDYWNHRGEIVWGKDAGYENAKDYIFGGNHDPLAYAPNMIGLASEDMPKPTRMPVGRFDVNLESSITDGELELATGVASLGEQVRTVCCMNRDVIAIEFAKAELVAVPNNSPDVVTYRKTYQIPEPICFEENDYIGWTQANGNDPVLCAMALKFEKGALLCAVLAETVEEAKAKAKALLDSTPTIQTCFDETKTWFANWWSNTPLVKIEHERHQTLYDYGMYRLAGFTQPGTAAPTLQGPWIEDDKMPPWGSDYHFNINVQMAHWPMLQGNHPEQFLPCLELIKGWFPIMEDYAKRFCGVEDGFMMPHGSDDRCMPADCNWSCQFDIGGAGWMALMYWDLYRYFEDESILRDFTYPMLDASMKVYEKLMKIEDGDFFYGPSPEYWDAESNHPWGKNPSFQLAIVHGLLGACEKAEVILGINNPLAAARKALAARLPKAAIGKAKKLPWTEEGDTIAVWDGLVLHESHRHHSHLAGIYPFDIFDLDGEDQTLIDHSMAVWQKNGQGQWTGWCTPWGAILWARRSEAQGAFHLLDAYDKFFMGPNHLSSHNAFQKGLTTIDGLEAPYIMQMDAYCGAVAAIFEMLAHERRGETHLAPAVPEAWGNVEFDRVRLPGNRTAKGRRVNGVWEVLEAK
ncbi:MAG: hypothetical protein MK193_06870 [Lentisphaeria bacterium]|nr:hypothetical protein [Lentisphaeria bacterium]